MKHDVILAKMIGYTQKIIAYCDGLDYDTFSGNSMLIEACVFNLSQIGELASKLDASFIQAHSNMPWKQLYGLRNRIVHDYEGVNLILVWEIVQNDLPDLVEMLRSI